MNNELFQYITIAMNLILIAVLIANIRTGNKVTKIAINKSKIDVKSMDYNELMDIVDGIIEQAFHFRVELVYAVKKDGHVFDYETELRTLVNVITSSFSADLVRAIESFVSREYFLSYITQRSEIFMIDQMRGNIVEQRKS